MEAAATPSFDIFIRNYDDGKPLITLTVKGTMTIATLKKNFAELCKADTSFLTF